MNPALAVILPFPDLRTPPPGPVKPVQKATQGGGAHGSPMAASTVGSPGRSTAMPMSLAMAQQEILLLRVHVAQLERELVRLRAGRGQA